MERQHLRFVGTGLTKGMSTIMKKETFEGTTRSVCPFARRYLSTAGFGIDKGASIAQEVVLREYPNATFWLEGRQPMGAGNLILTTRRLVFLHRVGLADSQIEKIQELSKAGVSQLTDFAFTGTISRFPWRGSAR